MRKEDRRPDGAAADKIYEQQDARSGAERPKSGLAVPVKPTERQLGGDGEDGRCFLI